MKRTSRSRHHNANSPGAVVTIKRRRQYRKKNRTQHCNKRKNATTRKNYKGGIFKYIKEKYVNYISSRDEARRRQETQRERLLPNVRSDTYESESVQPRFNSPPEISPVNVSVNLSRKVGVPIKQFMTPGYAETFKKLKPEQQEKLANPESSPPPLSASSSSAPSACSSPSPHTMFNTPPLGRIEEYGADNPWTVYKNGTLMPIWTSQLGNMQKAFTDHGSNIDGFLQLTDATDDLLDSNTDFFSYEAVIWAVVCDTQNLQNALMHSISTFKSEDAIVTCLVFQKFLFPF